MSARRLVLSAFGVLLLLTVAAVGVAGTVFGLAGLGMCVSHSGLARTEDWVAWWAILGVSFGAFALASFALVKRAIRALRGAPE